MTALLKFSISLFFSSVIDKLNLPLSHCNTILADLSGLVVAILVEESGEFGSKCCRNASHSKRVYFIENSSPIWLFDTVLTTDIAHFLFSLNDKGF